jgi:hypothetical protein
MKDLFVGVSSIRNGYSLLASGMLQWLPAVLSFEASTESDAVLSRVWMALGVEEYVLESLVKYRLLWQGTRLVVGIEHTTDPSLIDTLVSCLMAT